MGNVSALWITSYASPPTRQSLAKDAAAAMGGLDKLRAVQTIVMHDVRPMWRFSPLLRQKAEC